MSLNESRGLRLMKQLGHLYQSEEGDSSGTTLGGDSGLSQLGTIPNGVVGVITGKPKFKKNSVDEMFSFTERFKKSLQKQVENEQSPQMQEMARERENQISEDLSFTVKKLVEVLRQCTHSQKLNVLSSLVEQLKSDHEEE